jgi:hypothetical protein
MWSVMGMAGGFLGACAAMLALWLLLGRWSR